MELHELASVQLKYWSSSTNAKPTSEDFRYAVGAVLAPSHGPTPTVVALISSSGFVMMPPHRSDEAVQPQLYAAGAGAGAVPEATPR